MSVTLHRRFLASAISAHCLQSHRGHLHMGFPRHGGAAAVTRTHVPFLLPPQLGMPPHIRKTFTLMSTKPGCKAVTADTQPKTARGHLRLRNPACLCRKVYGHQSSRHVSPWAWQAHSPSSTMTCKAVLKQPDLSLGKLQLSIQHLLGTGRTCIWLPESDTEIHWG